MKITRTNFALLLTIALLAMQSGRVAAKGETPPTPIPQQSIDWDGVSPMKQGQLYKLPNCETIDPNAPCYVKILKSTNRVSVAASGPTQTLRCTVEVWNATNSFVVAKLWEDINVTWNTGSNTAQANWGSRGTWVLSGIYGWTNLSGPNPTPPWTINFYFGSTVFSSWGDITYFGSPWGNHRVDMTISGQQQWGCSGH